jgi:hypothetical protein
MYMLCRRQESARRRTCMALCRQILKRSGTLALSGWASRVDYNVMGRDAKYGRWASIDNENTIILFKCNCNNIQRHV